MLPLQITRRKMYFLRSWHMCLFRETYLYNTSNKTNSTSGNQRAEQVTSISFPKFHEGEGKKVKLPLAEFLFTVQNDSRASQGFPANAYHCSGRRCHAIWHSRPVKDILLRINAGVASKFIFILSCANYKDINVCVRHARKT